VLVAEQATADYFEAVAKGRDAKQAANWVTALLRPAQQADRRRHDLRPHRQGRVRPDVRDRRGPGQDRRGAGPEAGHRHDGGAIEPIIDKLIAANPGQVETYRKNPKVIGWFVGQVMKATGGKANPQAVNDLLKPKLRAARPPGSMGDFVGILAGKTAKVVTIDEMNESAAEGWAGRR
jgi:aspartyl-tRNA(Asn)/glutamyl-tRNA(Gln) amidotransferase subunit B